jgi:hypothetical protein
MSAPNRRRPGPRTVLAVAAAIFAVAGAVSLLARPSLEREILDPFTESASPLLAPYLTDSLGWRVERQGAATASRDGARGTYRHFVEEGEGASLRFSWRGAPSGALEVRLERRNRALKVWTPPPGDVHLDLRPFLDEPGEFFVHLDAKPSSTTGAGEGVRVEGVRFSFDLEPVSRRLGVWAWFAALSALCWAVLAFFLTPGALWAGVKATPLPSQHGAAVKVALSVCLAVGLCLIAADWRWRGTKDFDDVYAIAPAAALARHGFDPDQLFHRARVRPAFTAYLSPLQAIFPLRFASTSKWNADNWKRWFDKYDRPDATFAGFRYREFSAVSLLLLFGAIGLAGRLFGAAGMLDIQRLVALAVLAGVFVLILDNVVTFSFVTAMLWSAVAAAVWAIRRGGWAAMVWAGCALGAAALAKESALSVVPPVATALAFHVARSPNRRRATAQAAAYVGAAAIWPLLYYAAIIPGGLGNLAELFEEHTLQQRLYPDSFVPLTPWQALLNLWRFSGPFFAAALVGLALEIKRGRGRNFWTLFFAAWALGGCVAFLSPYVRPRFLVDLAPAIAYFTGRVIAPHDSS